MRTCQAQRLQTERYINVVVAVTGMPGRRGVGRAPAGPDLAVAYVCLLLLPFCIVPFCLLPLFSTPFSGLRVGGVLLGVGIYIQKKKNTTKIGVGIWGTAPFRGKLQDHVKGINFVTIAKLSVYVNLWCVFRRG